MTETDSAKCPLEMPEKFIPYLQKHRLYLMCKDLLLDLIINLPKDHLKHMKVYISHHLNCSGEADRIMLLVSPELNIDVKKLAKDMLKGLGLFVITRRYVMDRYEKHDGYVPGCISPELMSEVTKSLTMKQPVPAIGWIMFDHPCTVREAQCLQQDGVLPTVTLVLTPPPPVAPPAPNHHTPSRNFFQQDFEGLKYVYRATVKEVYVDSEEEAELALKCFNANAACLAGLQGAKQGLHVVGAPGVYRVLLIGPRGSGRRTQAMLLAKHFGLVYLNFVDLLNEAQEKRDEIGDHLRNYGTTVQINAKIVERRLLKKDCIDNGWVMTNYPSGGVDFENLDTMATPPNRIIFMNTDTEMCKKRLLSQGVDWCTGRPAAPGAGPRVLSLARDREEQFDNELDLYFSETLAEMRAAAGITAVEINANESIDNVQVKLQAAVIGSPAFDIECCCQLRNVRGD